MRRPPSERLPTSRLLSVTVVVAVALVLGACRAESEKPTPPPTPTGVPNALVPGACIASVGDPTVLGDTPITEDAIVDCAEPHSYEVLAAQDVPGAYLAGTEATEEDLTRLQAALDGARAEAIQVRFAAFARAYCAAALQRAVGLDNDAELAGVSIAAAQLTPITHRSSPYAALLTADWSEQPAMICVNRFVAPAVEPSEAPVVPVEGASTGLLLSADLPLDQRLCFSFDATGLPADASCEATHDAELTVSLDATALLDEEQLIEASSDASVPFADDVQERLDEVCSDALNLVMGEGRDEAITGGALRGDQGWGSGGMINEIRCYAVAADAALALPAGSVVGLGAETVELVPRG